MPTVETNGIETYYEDYGEGQPIVVLHGATADHQVWAEQLQPLTDEYRVILYDLRGHGKTGESARERYTVDTYADDLDAFINTLDFDQPAILGHSLGGMIGYTFATSYPEQLSTLITVGSQSPQLLTKSQWVTMNVIMRVGTLVAERDRLMNALQWAQLKLFGDDAAGDIDKLQKIRDAHGCGSPDIEPSERGKIMRGVREYYESSRTLEFSETSVFMLYGENEPMIEPHVEYFESQFETCQTAEIPDAGHNAQVDNSEYICTHIRAFLNDEYNKGEKATTEL